MNGSASVTHTSRPAEDVFADITRTPLRPPSGRRQARLCRDVPRAPLHLAGTGAGIDVRLGRRRSHGYG
jgi:hypothetical protein